MSTCCLFLTFTNFENRFFVAENRMEVFDEFGEDAAFEKVDTFGTVIWAISKEIFLRRVAMKIKIKLDSLEMFLSDFESQLMQSGDFRKYKTIKILELTIKIFTRV